MPSRTLKKLGIKSPFYAVTAALLLVLIILLSGCKKAAENVPTYAYIGGIIKNPTTNFITLKRNGKLLDTVYLDESNRFNYRIDNAENGLYLFKHKPETQNIYISPGDSLLFRANTLAFDESLYFSGKGQEKNNFMAEMFLLDEENSNLLLAFHEYNPTVFLRKADSIKQERMNSLRQNTELKEFSDDFVSLTEDIIFYENNDLKERYTFLVNKYYKEYSKQFPENFFSYRDSVDFNSIPLQCSPGYKRFVENYLINYSLTWCATSGLDYEDCYTLTNVENVKTRLRKAGELVQSPTIRRLLLKKIAVKGIVMAKSREDIISILGVLEDLEVSEADIEEMRRLGAIQLAFLPGTSLQNVRLLNFKGQLLEINEIIEKPTVIYLWSAYRENYFNEKEIIKEYREKYPEIDFIGINLDVDEEPAWRVAVRENSFDPQFQYQVGPTKIENEFYHYYLDKTLLVNSSFEVVRGDIYLNSPDFESKMLEFLNQ